jgi:hypothetical protein
MNADVYGQHDADSVIAASDPFVPDLSDVGALFYLQAPLTPDGNLPAAAWQQLCARVASLQPGQGLLPPLQQQLLDTLGCNSKGFLWLAPLWKARESEYLLPAAVRVCALTANNMKGCMRSNAAGAGGRTFRARVADAVLRQFLLLPALALRMELHQQRACARISPAEQGVDTKNLYHTLTVSVASLGMLFQWRELQGLVVSTGGGVGNGATGRAAGRTSADGVVPSDALFVPILHEVLQLLMHLLLGVMQTAQPGVSSSTSTAAGTCSSGGQGSANTTTSDSSSSSTSASSNSDNAANEPHEHRVSPASAASVLSGLFAVLLPAATHAVMEPASNSTATSSRSRNRSLAATWVPLLLRLTGALEQAMRFEAQWGPSQPELQALKPFKFWGGFAKIFPQGAAWGATFVLLSTEAHATLNGFDLFAPKPTAGQEVHGGDHTSCSSKPALLQWMLDNTPTRQLPAVQQWVLSALCTAAKVCRSAEGSNQLGQVTMAYSCIFHTAWSVLARLLSDKATPYGSNAAATTAGASSSSSSSQGLGALEQQETAAAAAGQQDPARGSSSHAATALSWLSLMGRCFLQASQQTTSTLQQCAASASLDDSQQEDPDQLESSAKASLAMLGNFCNLGSQTLARGIVRAAALTAAAAGRPVLQLPELKPGGLASAARYAEMNEALRVSDQEQQQLQGAGQQLAKHCSNQGLYLAMAAVQQSMWALAEAAAAAAPVYSGVRSCLATALLDRGNDLDLSGGVILYLLLESGVPAEHAMAVERSIAYM